LIEASQNSPDLAIAVVPTGTNYPHLRIQFTSLGYALATLLDHWKSVPPHLM
jgi:hypothetical protein